MNGEVTAALKQGQTGMRASCASSLGDKNVLIHHFIIVVCVVVYTHILLLLIKIIIMMRYDV